MATNRTRPSRRCGLRRLARPGRPLAGAGAGHDRTRLADQSGLDLLYSDEDRRDADGGRCAPAFKPDWDADCFAALGGVGRLGFYRAEIAGSTERESFHRLLARPAPRVGHLADVLCHRAPNAPAEPAIVRPTRPTPQSWPGVSVIVPTRDRARLLRDCLDGLDAQTDYPDLDVLVVDNDSRESETLALLRDREAAGRIRVLRHPGTFNYASMNNRAALHTRGQLLCFLNNDVRPIDRGWLKEMAREALRPEIGAVGAKLLYPDGTVQHAGVVLGLGGVAGHGMQRLAGHDGGYLGLARTPRRVSAVTGACLLVGRDVFDQVGGFDPGFRVDYNDIDLCLRIGSVLGLGVFWTPRALLTHEESASRGLYIRAVDRPRYEAERARMIKRWGSALTADPCYNVNLSREAAYDVALPPAADWSRSGAST